MSEGRGAVIDHGASFAALCADEIAFTAWYEGALPRVYGFVHGRVGGDHALAEDITAQAFQEAIRAHRSFDGRSDPVTWICSIARNRVLDHYRRVAREQVRHLRLVVTDLRADDTRDWERVDRQDSVLTALSALAPFERNALILRYLDGYSVRETARLIGRSEAATESLLSRARERVRAAFPRGPE